MRNRFLIITDAEEPFMEIVPESKVSERFNMADTDMFGGYPFKVFYLEDNGTLSPVELKKKSEVTGDIFCITHGYSEIHAGGKQVGLVIYTDH